MKNIVIIMISALAGVLCSVLVSVFGGKLYRAEEVAVALPCAVEKTVEQRGRYSEEKRGQDMVAACAANLAVSLDSNSDITMQVMKADGEKGVLSVRLQESFVHPNGAKDVVQCERTVIADVREEEKSMPCEVRFYKNKQEMQNGLTPYKAYTVAAGSCIKAPVAPVAEVDEEFVTWKDACDYIADFSVPIEQSIVYYADWEVR